MKKFFEEPEIKIEVFMTEDVLQASDPEKFVEGDGEYGGFYWN